MYMQRKNAPKSSSLIQLIQTQSNIIPKHNTDTNTHLDDQTESEDTPASKSIAAITFASPFIYFLFPQNQSNNHRIVLSLLKIIFN